MASGHVFVVQSVSEGKHLAERVGDPVATAVRRSEDDTRWVEMVEGRRRRRAEVGGIAVSKHLPVTVKYPVTLPIRCGDRRRDGRTLEGRSTQARCVTERVDVAGRCHQPIA